MNKDNNMNNILWQTKVAARLHDPAEKALVLLRDPAGHENGTSRALIRLLGFHNITTETVDPDNDEALVRTVFKKGIPADMYKHVQHADWWAAAADRPQWPMEEITVTTKKGAEKTLTVADWAQVRWTNNPVLTHPLTGAQFDLGKHGGLSDTDFHEIKQKSFDHLSSLLVALNKQNSDEADWKKIQLALWRFGAELQEENDNGKLGALWGVLPADTRIPDHSIWDHLDLTSAFAGAFAADPDGEVALLSLAIGPVQSFIASARKMDDLWAGSHLLARLSWEAMRPVCEQLGPDAILFPRLRGVPQVDLWLRDQMDLPDELFKHCEWNKGNTDSNPLFSAALPNRFVAVVPASQAKSIAESVEQHVRQWLQNLGADIVTLLLSEAGYRGEQENITTPYDQMKEQLHGFPEVHWAAVPFSLIQCKDQQKQKDLDVTQLSAAMQPFFEGNGEPGFLATRAWQLLQNELLMDEQGKKSVFFAPNPGVLYPAVHDLAERVLAAAKSTRTFGQTKQEGWRCSMSGETEWLTTDRKQLEKSYRQQTDTLWAKIAEKKPAWAKEGEHLGALAAIKRLWPTLFAEEVGKALGKKDIGRFVVSTHTMALAHQIDQWLEHGGLTEEGTSAALKKSESVALPRRLMKRHIKNPALMDAKYLPGLLDVADEKGDEQTSKKAERLVKQTLGVERLETYYGLILMDGDRMGAWLAGGDDYAISYRESFHPQVQAGFDKHANNQQKIKQYGQQKRALSPNRHLAISGALNDFSLTVVRHVVEEEHLGRLIYAGGDDVFAMLPVVDLLSAMQRLRYAYSGHDPEHEGGVHEELTLHKGFAILKGKLMRMMGTKATASCGAVIAHHQAPLGAVRRELAAAEKRAKNEEERNAFSITIIKRSGGALYLTEKWGEPVNLLMAVRSWLTEEGVSRRAVYHTLAWLNERELPATAFDSGMVQTLLAYQLDRQAKGDAKAQTPDLARRLATLAMRWPQDMRIEKLRNFLSVAEFLARETRQSEQNHGGDA